MMAILRKYNDTVITMLHRPNDGTSEDDQLRELKTVVLWKQILRFLHVSIPKDKVSNQFKTGRIKQLVPDSHDTYYGGGPSSKFAKHGL